MVTSENLAGKRRVREGPRLTSPDSIFKTLSSSDQVPIQPETSDRSPIDPANPGFSAAPRATGFILSTDSTATRPWQSDPPTAKKNPASRA